MLIKQGLRVGWIRSYWTQCQSYPGVLQVLNVSDAVAVFHSSGQHSEALPSDSVHDRSSIGEEVDTPDEQHAAII